MDVAYQLIDYYGISNTVSRLTEDQELVMVLSPSGVPATKNTNAYFIEGTFSSDKASDSLPIEFQNDNLVITLTKNNENDAKKAAYLGICRSIEYTDTVYVTPSSAANSYTPENYADSSEGIEYSYRIGEDDTRIVTITIPEDYTSDTVHVNMSVIQEVFGELSVSLEENGEIVNGGYESSAFMDGKEFLVPGVQVPYQIEVVNLSSKKYVYQTDSLWLSTAFLDNYNGYVSEQGTYPTFDGSDRAFIVYRTWNTPLLALLDTSEALDDNTINEALQNLYQNEADIEENLPHYYLDYYNFIYGSDATVLEDLPEEAILDMFDGYRDTSGITSQGVVYSRETISELNHLAYNFLYTKAVHIDEDDFFSTSYDKSAGSVMAGANSILEDRVAAIWNEINAASTAAVLNFELGTSFYLGNAYMRYPIACDMGFDLKEFVEAPDTSDDPSYPPRPDPDPSEPEEEIPDESTPTTSGPDGEVVPEGPGGDGEEIPDESTPLTSVPTEDIDDDETPVTAPPKTGSAATSASLILAAASALGLVLLRKKK